MTDLERMIICGSVVNKVHAEEGYTRKNLIPWKLVGICVGLDILNSATRSASRVPYEQAKMYRRKHF